MHTTQPEKEEKDPWRNNRSNCITLHIVIIIETCISSLERLTLTESIPSYSCHHFFFSLTVPPHLFSLYLFYFIFLPASTQLHQLMCSLPLLVVPVLLLSAISLHNKFIKFNCYVSKPSNHFNYHFSNLHLQCTCHSTFPPNFFSIISFQEMSIIFSIISFTFLLILLSF